jgi:very-short-patch-repair endonuclease
MRTQLDTERWLAALATRQHGVVARRQLLAVLSADAIGRMVRAGRLHPVHRGVYAVGHQVLGPKGRWMAAVLACGEGAVLSHGSAAVAWELRPSGSAWIDVSVPSAAGRAKRRPLRIHRTRLHPADVTVLDAIPITTPARTLADLAATLTPRQLERALDEAEILKLLDMRALEDAMTRIRNGRKRLRATLNTHTAGTTATRSGLEERFLALCRNHEIPQPLVNQRIQELTVDFLWPATRLVVESDSMEFHGTLRGMERDRRRDAYLARLGYRTLRFTSSQVTREPATVAATLTAALSLASPLP